MSRLPLALGAAAFIAGAGWCAEPTAPLVRHNDVGRAVTPTEIAVQDITILPNGAGLPVGRGTAREGRAVYLQHCAACHGPNGEGVGDYAALVGGRDTLGSAKPVLTVGSYWPYATSIWDYIRRAMPYNTPGSLTNDEVYAVTAWLLSANGIVPETALINQTTLPQVRMPNRGGFVADPRPDVGRKPTKPKK